MQSVSDIRFQVQEAIRHRLRHQARHTLGRFCQALMEAERDAVLGCRPHERSAHRRGYRNGYEGRSLETVFGVLRLRTPRVRDTDGTLRTILFDACQRRGRDVEAAVEGWVARWHPVEPEAVATLLEGFDETLRYLNLPPALRRRVRTTNPIERLMGEIEKATDHVPVWEDARSWERHVWILWKRLKHRGYRPTRPRPEFTRTS